MKFLLPIFLIVIVSCNNKQQKAEPKDTIPSHTSNDISVQNNNEMCWAGTINKRTPVFLHYKIDSNLIIGEITYLNTKEKLPILLLGTIKDDKSYRILEFEKSGNISGIVTGLPSQNKFTGSWFSPKSKTELTLNLTKKDTVINPVITQTKLQDIFGRYHYQYSEAGYQGDLNIVKVAGGKAAFSINSVTNDPARNIAQIDEDTIKLNDIHFIYKVPETDSCEFEVKFYKRFAFIRYTRGYCDGQFGNNATIDGIFLKTE